MAQNKNGIVFFDGVCGLCNRFVDFALTADKNQALKFAPLQGMTAKKYQARIDALKSDSIVLIDDSGIYDRSDAFIRICQQIGGAWTLMIVLRIVPLFFRDFLYNQVARSRYSLWGKSETCRLPTSAEQGRILD